MAELLHVVVRRQNVVQKGKFKIDPWVWRLNSSVLFYATGCRALTVLSSITSVSRQTVELRHGECSPPWMWLCALIAAWLDALQLVTAPSSVDIKSLLCHTSRHCITHVSTPGEDANSYLLLLCFPVWNWSSKLENCIIDGFVFKGPRTEETDFWTTAGSLQSLTHSGLMCDISNCCSRCCSAVCRHTEFVTLTL